MKFNDFDLFAIEAKPRFSAKTSKIKTNIGAIMSIFSVVCVVTYGSILLDQMLNRKEKTFISAAFSYDL